jgi:hypothetical protein
MLGELKTSDAAAFVQASVGALLRRLTTHDREPDRWEAELTIRAITLLKSARYEEAVYAVTLALIPPERRDPAACTAFQLASKDLAVLSLGTLQRIFSRISREARGSASLH